ncbi:adenylate/guanylate cyclase domain-containing protein [Thiorhodococcus mannitoliphagus]|uniref:Adenylate/guanylate cyclase domain-containing protein n=1 Tax=Thiorhodococcus mannitoliphagus TaxID=329406 RepID=A0A6P1DRC3_9GAMM|nr:adenylate/guanylate cyclase domain-containing protein [Thiorhodococcus mannitoliphagus]NEX19723.1 adenylate/guanylate cyclase domain-containing protein [Thiorhodococcus mannitoliphagus]
MSEQVETLTLVFADISGSTRIIQAHGDQVAHQLIQRCLECVAAAVRLHHGQVREKIGDELMCTFADPREALRAALEIQRAVKAAGEAGELPATLRMHVGLHHGRLLVQQDQLFGDTIHIAKRMVDLAKTDQILTTQETLNAAGVMSDMRFRVADQIRIKGYDAPVEIYEVMRQDPSVTLIAQSAQPLAMGEHYCRCSLSYGGQSFTLDAKRHVLSIGREEGNDLMIPESCVSRRHGRLEYQKGRIIYVDQSTNGTSIFEDDAQAPIIVHREQRWLRGRGLLRFGQRSGDTGQVTLHYRCETSTESPPTQ